MSTIAELRAQIAAEHRAVKQGLSGLALGTAQHAFIAQSGKQGCY